MVERNNVEEAKFERPEWLDEVTGILETLNQGVIINDACAILRSCRSRT